MSNCTQNSQVQQLGKIASIVREVEKLSDTDKLLLYLQLPCGRANLNLTGEGPASQRHHKSTSATSPSQQQQQQQQQRATTSTNGGGDELIICAPKKPDNETTLTYTWILSHLEEDPNISLPKQEVYDEYRAFCQANRFEPLCVADFGKAMKHALPCIKPRRLGQRGNSRYCYSGLRKKYRIDPPTCADLTAPNLTPPPPPPQLQPGSGKRAADHHQPTGPSNRPSASAKYQPPSAHQQQHQHQRHPAAHPSGVLRNMQALDLPSGGSSGSGGNSGGGGDGQQGSRSHTPSLASFSSGSGRLSSAGPPQQKHFKSEGPNVCSAEGCGGGGGPSKQQVAPCCAQAPNPSTYGGLIQNTGVYAGTAADPNRTACVIEYTPSHRQHHNSATSNSNNNNNNRHRPHHQQHQYNSHAPPQVNNAINGQAPAPYQQQQQQQSCLPRPGTPDDDDYRHNYHDLNRPIIGPAIIPFSQSMSVQLAKQPAPHESFISYNNTCYPAQTPQPPPPPPPQPPSQQQQQQQQPSATTVPPTPANQQQQQQQQSHHMVMVPSCCSHETSLATVSSSNTLTMVASAATNSTRGDNGHHFDGSPVRNHTLAHLNLNTESADMDFASPFQSPASTPYSSMLTSNSANPYLGGGGGGQDTQDYYMQQECNSNIPYPDLQ